MTARRKKIFLLVLLLGLVSFGGSKAAADPSSGESPKNAGYRLTLDEASRLALVNNFDIQLAQYDIWVARTRNGVARSIYDAVIEAEVDYRNNQAGRTTTITGTKSLDNDYSVGVSKKLPTGTTLRLDSTNNRNWSNSPFATINPSHDTALGVTVEQELGRNFFGLQDRGSVRLTRLDVERSTFLSLERIEDQLAQVQTAYWQLVLQNENVRIQQSMLDLAKELLDNNEKKLPVGLVEQPDVLAARANYRQKVNDLMLARNQMQTQANVLRLLLNIPDDEVAITPTDKFGVPPAVAPLDQSLRTAFDNRYDYKEALKAIKSKDINLEMKKGATWPEINLTASLARNGIDDHFNQAFSKIAEEDNPNFFAGLRISLPLENNKARSELEAAQLEKARTLISLKQLERRITLSVVDQVRLCRVLKETAANARTVAELQTEKLEAEKKRFDTGRSDTDTIIRYQEDAALARLQAAQAMYDYYASRIELRRVEADLLNEYWDEAGKRCRILP